jgi:hypothetical protein
MKVFWVLPYQLDAAFLQMHGGRVLSAADLIADSRIRCLGDPAS